MKKSILNYLIGTLIIVAGAIFIFNPLNSIRELLKYTGIVFVIIGTVKIIYSSVIKDGFTIGSGGVLGIFLFIIGLIFSSTNFFTIDILSSILSIYLIASSLPAIIYSKNIKQYKNTYFISNLLKLVFGACLLIVPAFNVLLTGICFGVVLIIFGLSFFINSKEEKLYSVKVKK